MSNETDRSTIGGWVGACLGAAAGGFLFLWFSPITFVGTMDSLILLLLGASIAIPFCAAAGFLVGLIATGIGLGIYSLCKEIKHEQSASPAATPQHGRQASSFSSELKKVEPCTKKNDPYHRPGSPARSPFFSMSSTPRDVSPPEERYSPRLN